MTTSSKIGGADLRRVDLICFSMSSFPSEPTSAAAMANTSYSNGKKKNGNEKMRNKQGVKLSTDPQSVAARERRHRISHRFKILQSLVPGGTKMDIVSMLEEAIHYVKFLKTQISLHQAMMMSTMHDDYNLRPPTPCPYWLPSSSLPSHQSVSSTAPISMEPEQVVITPSLAYYFCQAQEDHETMFT